MACTASVGESTCQIADAVRCDSEMFCEGIQSRFSEEWQGGVGTMATTLASHSDGR